MSFQRRQWEEEEPIGKNTGESKLDEKPTGTGLGANLTEEGMPLVRQ